MNYVGIALSCIAFESVLVNIISTLGYFWSTLEYVGSTLEYIGSTFVYVGYVVGHWIMLGVYWNVLHL